MICRNSHLARRLLAMVLTVCICFTGMTWLADPSAVRADETSDLQAQIADLEAQLQEAQEQAAALQDEIDAQQEIQDNLTSQIETIQQQVTLYQQQIDALEVQIEEQNQQIESLNAQILQAQTRQQEVKELFHQRMLALYLEGNTSTLELLLGAKSYSDFLTRSQYMSSQASSDQAMLDELLALETQINENLAEVESTLSSLEANQAELESLQAEQDAKIAELQTLQQQSEAEEASLLQSQEAYNQDAEQYQEELDRANAELEAIARANANKYASALQSSESSTSSSTSSSSSSGSSSSSVSTSGDGSYLWPCASYTISSYYGYRSGSMHRGIDISASAGTDIYASKSGVVVVSMMGYSGSGFGGYGNVIMIQHSDGTYTLYAHCQTRYVSVGDVVTQGQVIAAVGSTGNSTGNHLHFEIRTGVSSSTTVDPMNYF